MVPFQRGKPTGEHDLGWAIHQGRHVTSLRWPESSLLQIGGVANQNGVDFAQECGGPSLLGCVHGAEEPIEFSVWPGHIPIQRDIDIETYFSHVDAPSLGKRLVLALLGAPLADLISLPVDLFRCVRARAASGSNDRFC